MWLVEGLCGQWRAYVISVGLMQLVEGLCGQWRVYVVSGRIMWLVEGLCGQFLCLFDLECSLEKFDYFQILQYIWIFGVDIFM